MNETTLLKLENLFLALSDKTRLRLLALMANGEVSVGFLADELDESQPKISRHLAYLRTAAVVSTRRDGKRIYYAIENQANHAVAAVLNTTLDSLSGRNNDAAAIKTHPRSVEPTVTGHTIEFDTLAETYMNDWRPNELEVFLL